MKCDACGAPVENGKCTYCGKDFGSADILETEKPNTNHKYSRPTTNHTYSRPNNASNTQGNWTNQQNPPKKKGKGCLTVILVFLAIGFIGSLFGDKDTDSSAHLYDSAEVKEVLNGTRDEKIGEYSIIKAKSDEVTEESLADWYYNYVEKNDYNYCVILYSDKNDNSGVYSIEGIVDKDVILNEDEYGDYSLGDASNETVYSPTEDNKTLKVIEN